jgi:hypothetical protein
MGYGSLKARAHSARVAISAIFILSGALLVLYATVAGVLLLVGLSAVVLMSAKRGVAA